MNHLSRGALLRRALVGTGVLALRPGIAPLEALVGSAEEPSLVGAGDVSGSDVGLPVLSATWSVNPFIPEDYVRRVKAAHGTLT